MNAEELTRELQSHDRGQVPLVLTRELVFGACWSRGAHIKPAVREATDRVVAYFYRVAPMYHIYMWHSKQDIMDGAELTPSEWKTFRKRAATDYRIEHNGKQSRGVAYRLSESALSNEWKNLILIVRRWTDLRMPRKFPFVLPAGTEFIGSCMGFPKKKEFISRSGSNVHFTLDELPDVLIESLEILENRDFVGALGNYGRWDNPSPLQRVLQRLVEDGDLDVEVLAAAVKDEQRENN
jgi:hypothetical protein